MTLTIPAHLPGGTYTLQAAGDETLSVELVVIAAAGTSAQPANEVAATVTPRARTGLGIAVLAVFVLVVAVLGLALVARAERLGRLVQRP